MAVVQSAMHDWLDHPVAVSRPRPSPAYPDLANPYTLWVAAYDLLGSRT